MKTVDETKTLQFSLDDTLGHETVDDAISHHRRVMLNDGWYETRRELLEEMRVWHVTYRRSQL